MEFSIMQFIQVELHHESITTRMLPPFFQFEAKAGIWQRQGQLYTHILLVNFQNSSHG